jgi:hypothetical protein
MGINKRKIKSCCSLSGNTAGPFLVLFIYSASRLDEAVLHVIQKRYRLPDLNR